MWQYAFVNDAIGYIRNPLVEYRRFEDSATSERYDSKLTYRVLENQIFLDGLNAIMRGCFINNSRIEQTINRCYLLETKRKQMFTSKSLGAWIECLKYIDCYPYKRSWLVDLYLLYRG